MIEAGLSEGTKIGTIQSDSGAPVAVKLAKLTWAGHDFIDAIASEAHWPEVKDFLQDGGKQITVETVRIAADQLFGAKSL